MNANTLREHLAGLPLGEIHYFASTGSTNDDAAMWAAQGASEYSLVVADEQTKGRGRAGRTWYSLPGSSLSFSLVLHPKETEEHIPSRLTALGALAVCSALHQHFGLPAQIKWPNDVLLQRKKVAGVLVEACWSGNVLQSIILGVGINITAESAEIAMLRQGQLRFPATSVYEQLGYKVAPEHLLHGILTELIHWRSQISTQLFVDAWETYLAFKGETVQIAYDDNSRKDGFPMEFQHPSPVLQEGRVIGLTQDGSLKLRLSRGETIKVHYGEVRLRPLEQGLAETTVRF